MKNNPNLIVSETNESWPETAIALLDKIINETLSHHDECNVFLTGGKTAERLYQAWAPKISQYKKKINFYWGDERYVPLDNPQSNYAMTMNSLFPQGLPSNINLFPVMTNLEKSVAMSNYEAAIPSRIDLILLSIGSDSHIASLFPGSKGLKSNEKIVYLDDAPYPPFERFSISQKTILEARKIVLFATGKEKGLAVSNALKHSDDYVQYPACLALSGDWVLDQDAYLQIFPL
jgi:6-phosphogluconolactonase